MTLTKATNFMYQKPLNKRLFITCSLKKEIKFVVGHNGGILEGSTCFNTSIFYI